MFKINENVIYTFSKKARIEQVHYDDPPQLYYTIKLYNLNNTPQTTSKNLILIEKKGPIEPYDKGDIVIYKKEVETKIYDINIVEDMQIFKIKFNNIFKFVKGKKLKKI